MRRGCWANICPPSVLSFWSLCFISWHKYPIKIGFYNNTTKNKCIILLFMPRIVRKPSLWAKYSLKMTYSLVTLSKEQLWSKNDALKDNLGCGGPRLGFSGLPVRPPPTRGCQIGALGTLGFPHNAYLIVIDTGVAATCISAAAWARLIPGAPLLMPESLGWLSHLCCSITELDVDR